jgi:Peptidase_C39 like family
MSQISNQSKKVANKAVDKAIVFSLSPLITPIGANIVAKGKGIIIFGLVTLFLMFFIIFAGGGDKKIKDDKKAKENGTGSIASKGVRLDKLPNGVTATYLNVPYINQWRNNDGTTSPNNILPGSGWRLGWVTCGATSSVMIGAFFGKLKFTNDKSLKEYAYMDKGQNLPNYCMPAGIMGGAFGVTAQGYCNQSSQKGIQDYLSRINLKSNGLKLNQASIIKSIDEGKPIILSITEPLGHILVVKGYTSDNRVIVNDPFGDENESTTNYSLNGESAVYDLYNDFAVNYLLQVSQ